MITRRALFLLLIAAPILALATITSAALWAAGLYLLGVLFFMALDFLLSPRPGQFRLERRNESKLSLGADNLITIVLRRLGNPEDRLRGRPVTFLVRDEPPTEYIISLMFMPGTIAPGGTVELEYTARPLRRGDYRFGGCYLRYSGVLGLVIRQHRYPIEAPVKVYPNLLEVRKYELLARKDQLFEIGLKNARRLGQGTEFERLRDYEQDDDYRRINWPATARLHKPIMTDYQPERSQSVIVMLDAGRLMTAPLGSLSKLDYAINTTLLLAYVAIVRGDRVGLLTFADTVTGYWEPDKGRRQFLTLLEALYKVQAQQVEPDYMRASAFLSTRRSKRSLIVLFTDILDAQQAGSMVRGFGRLAPRHLPLAVTMSDTEVLAMSRRIPGDTQQMYEKVLAQNLLDDRATALEALQRLGALTLDVPADKLTISVVNKYLELKARGRL
ncbi:MAG TPA: DUF58 domain-containing protein [Chloroflexia bacterium]|nr:DUF58 domain-containing protein [Chloroflexia bacterium]